MIHQRLDTGWKIYPTEDHAWEVEATVPCSVLHAMVTNNLAPDPFYRKNEYGVRDLFAKDYSYSLTFTPDPDVFQQQHTELVFYGLDTLAEISLNGEPLANTNNMHRTWRFPLDGRLKPGKNTLNIIFRSSLNYIREKGKDPDNHYTPKGGIHGSSCLRKAHCMFGWDWGPQLPDAGIWRPVELVGYTAARIEDVYIAQEHADHQVAVAAHIRLEQEDETDVCLIRASLTASDGTVWEQEVQSAAGEADVTWVVDNPELWWPNTYGNQPLYTVEVNLYWENDATPADTWQNRIGLRTMTVSRDKDQWGEEFCFKVNGLKIFSCGADYIPEDNILTRVTPESTRRLLEDCAAANFNSIRVWGGGCYPDDNFFDLCDELGLIVWEDAMFACNVYRLDKEFESNIRAELKDNLTRVRHHASLGLLCGNNEMEFGWIDWPNVIDHKPYLKADYIKQFEYVIPQEAENAMPDTFFWPSSPSSGGSFDDPNSEERGDVHYWDVWHKMKPFTDYEKKYFRFCSEFGFESFPCMKTVRTYTEPQDWNIFSPMMESHQKNGAANGLIMYYISSYYRYPKDFESLLYVSQLLQAEAMRYGVEHWRRNRGRCMGAIYWQLNDCWPVASWASIDYYGRWKALHYYARRFFAPQMVTAKAEDGVVKLWVHNDSRNALSAAVDVELRALDFTLLAEKHWQTELEPLSVQQQADWDVQEMLQGRDPAEVVVCFRMNGEAWNSTLFSLPKQLELQKPHYTTRVEDTGDTFTITICSDTYAHQVEVDTNLTDRPFSDNDFPICTPEGRAITMDKKNLPDGTAAADLLADLHVRSIADTY